MAVRFQITIDGGEADRTASFPPTAPVGEPESLTVGPEGIEFCVT